MKLVAALTVLSGAVALGCDAVPDLYVVDASLEPTEAGEAGPDDVSTPDGGEDGGADASDGDACGGYSCPACPPSPGMCCAGGIPCLGGNCAKDCAACAACSPGQVCCSKPGNAKPVCHGPDAATCP